MKALIQKNLIQQYADRNELEIIRWFGDEGKSAKTVSKRDDMMTMLNYCAANKGQIGYTNFLQYETSF